MAIRHHRSVWVGLLGALSALVLSACSAPAEPVHPGELELIVDPQASYAMVGRFQVNAIEPWSPSRDIDFHTTTTSARVELPPGSFTLALGAGARLVCAGEEEELTVSSVPRLVSAAPRVFSITSGRVTTARISFGAAHAQPSSDALGADHLADAADPCGTSVEIASALQ